jgi:transposase
MSKMPHHKGSDYKVSAVQYYLRINNQVKTCEIFGCSPRSLMRWVERYQETGTVRRINREPISYKMEKEHVAFLLKELRKNQTITIAELQTLLQKNYPDLDISRVHIGRVIRDNNQTLKQARIRHEPTERYGKPVDISKQLKDFYATIMNYNLDEIICIDETSLNSFMVRKHCRSKLGKRCILKTHSQEVFKKYTGIFAISTHGCVGYEVYDKGGIDSQRLINFLEARVLANQKGKVILLDNASSHRNPEVKKIILKNNILLYSVPYQHYTNAIENFFSVLKSHMRKEKPIGKQAILEAIKKALERIPKKHYIGFYKNAFERDKPVEKKPSTRERLLKNYR